MNTEPWLSVEQIAEHLGVTRDSIKAVLEAMSAHLARPEPLAEFMRAHGFDPTTHVMILADSMKSMVGPFPPRYVQFSSAVPAGTVYFRLKDSIEA